MKPFPESKSIEISFFSILAVSGINMPVRIEISLQDNRTLAHKHKYAARYDDIPRPVRGGSVCLFYISL